MQQGYVDVTEIDADILGKLLGSEEYVTRLAVRKNNLVTKLYTQFKSARDNTQSKQARRALNKLTDKFGKAIDNAKGGVLVSSIKDYEDEEKENAESADVKFAEDVISQPNDRRSQTKKSHQNTFDYWVDRIDNISDEEAIKIAETDPFVKVMDYTPEILTKYGAGNHSIIMRFDTMYLAQRKDGALFGGKENAHYHGLGREMSKLKDFLESPDVILKTNDGRLKLLHSISTSKGQALVSLDINKVKDIESNYQYYNVVVTYFDYEQRYLKNQFSKFDAEILYEKESLEQVNPQLHKWMRIINSSDSNNTISQDKAVVNSNFTQKSEKDASSAERSSDINERASYAGPKAETADRGLLSKAQEMLDNGYDSETVRKETGWFKGYDGKWRFEIDDFESSFIENPNLERHEDDGEVYFTGKLSDIFDHKELFEAYPKLMDINIVVQKTEFGVDAIYQPNSNYITLSREHFKRYTKAYNEYLNGGRKTEIEQIEQTPEFKEYNKWYDDEIADNMEPLAWLEGELAARNSFFSSDLGKRYYQLKYSKDGFTGEKFELGWDKGAKEVLLHELQHAVQKIEGFAAGTNTRDKNYDKSAGEIEAFDTGRRANLTVEQRKNTRPDIDREDVVVKNVIGDSFLYIGDTKDDRRCYVSGFDSSLSMDEKIKLFKERIATIFNLGAVELKTDVKKIIIKGDKFTAQKNIYGDFLNTTGEQNAKINSLYDLADILATSKYDPNSTQPETSYVNPNVKPKNAAHKGVKYWYKFKNNIVFDNVPYTVTFNIRDKGKEQYQYLIEFKEDKTPGLSNTAVKNLLRTDQASYTNSIPQNSDLSTKKSDINERSSKTGKDTVEMSRGEIAKFRANYTSDKVFNKRKISEALNDISLVSKLPADVRNELVQSLWKGFNEHRAYDLYSKVMTERLYATIMQESEKK